ncbi:hypothetical protein RI054_24g102290 [Pseudoscourfieldia marina]
MADGIHASLRNVTATAGVAVSKTLRLLRRHLQAEEITLADVASLESAEGVLLSSLPEGVEKRDAFTELSIAIANYEEGAAAMNDEQMAALRLQIRRGLRSVHNVAVSGLLAAMSGGVAAVVPAAPADGDAAAPVRLVTKEVTQQVMDGACTRFAEVYHHDVDKELMPTRAMQGIVRHALAPPDQGYAPLVAEASFLKFGKSYVQATSALAKEDSSPLVVDASGNIVSRPASASVPDAKDRDEVWTRFKRKLYCTVVYSIVHPLADAGAFAGADVSQVNGQPVLLSLRSYTKLVGTVERGLQSSKITKEKLIAILEQQDRAFAEGVVGTQRATLDLPAAVGEDEDDGMEGGMVEDGAAVCCGDCCWGI